VDSITSCFIGTSDWTAFRHAISYHNSNVVHIISVTIGNGKHLCSDSFQCSWCVCTSACVVKSVNGAEDIGFVVEGVQVKGDCVSGAEDVDTNSHGSVINIC